MTGGEQRARPVPFHRSALEDEGKGPDCGIGVAGEMVADLRIARQLIFPAPAIETEAQRLKGPRCIARKNRSCIAQPDITESGLDNLDRFDDPRARRMRGL